jgi:hypothetical protein
MWKDNTGAGELIFFCATIRILDILQQIPQYLFEAGWAAGERVVVCTQPRRVAVQTVSARVAEEVRPMFIVSSKILIFLLAVACFLSLTLSLADGGEPRRGGRLHDSLRRQVQPKPNPHKIRYRRHTAP